MTTPSQAQTALDEYGPLAQIVQAVPDLNNLLNGPNGAIAQQWTPGHLQAAIMATPWYQQHSDTMRSLLLTQASDPQAFQQQLSNATAHVRQMAGQMGRALNPDAFQNYAYQYLANGWDDTRLQTALSAEQVGTEGNGAYSGQAGQIQTHLEQTAQSYGVPYTYGYIASWVAKVQSGADTVDGFDAAMKARAIAQYPQYGAQLDAGQTMLQIADPYMAQMAKTLEIPQTSVRLDNPAIQKALSVRDPQSGAVTSQAMWAFTQQLKADPRYDQTTQAKTDAYSTLAQIGKDFGFQAGVAGTGTGR